MVPHGVKSAFPLHPSCTVQRPGGYPVHMPSSVVGPLALRAIPHLSPAKRISIDPTHRDYALPDTGT